MLIDWITARVSCQHFSRDTWLRLSTMTDRVMRYCPRTQEIRWETMAWDSIRSDSHQLAFRVGSDALHIQGSPARCCGDGDTVFGSGPSSSLDLKGCVTRMARFISGQIETELPIEPQYWEISRIDITANLLLDSLEDVRMALSILRSCEGGRYRVSQQAGDTVYWSHRSRIRSGKAYAKGPHIVYMQKQREYTGRKYDDKEIQLINRLLRLELKLGSQYLRERSPKWYNITPQWLENQWRGYFERMIGDADMKTDNQIKERIYQAAETLLPEINKSRKNPIKSSEGMAKSAYGCWLLIQSEGWEKAREAFSKTTWYRHLRILRLAGLGDADISMGQVVPIRRRIFEAQIVHDFHQLRQLAA